MVCCWITITSCSPTGTSLVKRAQMLLPRNLAILKHGTLRVGSTIGKESDRGGRKGTDTCYEAQGLGTGTSTLCEAR